MNQTLDTRASVLVNDVDGDGDPLVAILHRQPPAQQGVVSRFGTHGRFRFTPAQGFQGTAEFTYRARDPYGRFSDPILVRIRVD